MSHAATIQTTLLELVNAVNSVTHLHDEALAVILSLIYSGRVKLVGQFDARHLRALLDGIEAPEVGRETRAA